MILVDYDSDADYDADDDNDDFDNNWWFWPCKSQRWCYVD